MKQFIIKTYFLHLLISFLFVSAAYGTELFISSANVPEQNTLKIKTIIDQIDNLAGIKICFEYDPGSIKFNKMTKSKATSSLMHIVNSKNPGRLIIVMAGAKGVTGEKLELFDLDFEKTGKNIKTVVIKISTVELLSDSLKEIKCLYKQINTFEQTSGNEKKNARVKPGW